MKFTQFILNNYKKKIGISNPTFGIFMNEIWKNMMLSDQHKAGWEGKLRLSNNKQI